MHGNTIESLSLAQLDIGVLSWNGHNCLVDALLFPDLLLALHEPRGLGTQSNWLEVRLIGAGYGTFGMQNGLTLHFGLGIACDIQKIVVRWPDAPKSVSTFAAARANDLVEIRQVGGSKATLRHIAR